MSKAHNMLRDQKNLRWQLLTTVSAVSLLGAVANSSSAAASGQDADRPTVWIELGAQLDDVSGSGDVFAPPFVGSTDWTAEKLRSPATVQNLSPYVFGGEGQISFEPAGTDWIFSAGVRYGRSNAKIHAHDQPQHPNIAEHFGPSVTKYYIPSPTNVADTTASSSKAHTIVDFQAGKDIGIGMFGSEGLSVFSAGVRFAQFNSRSDISSRNQVNAGFFNALGPSLPPSKYVPAPFHNLYMLSGHSERSFHGVGPSLSWQSSVFLSGNREDAGITFDWGIDAAVLFGRQKAKVSHHTTGEYFVHQAHNGYSAGYTTLYKNLGGHSTDRSVVVPNLGGMAGVSFRYSNAKVSFGYRADYFLGAMDGGIDARKSEPLGFRGPYASISFGLGN